MPEQLSTLVKTQLPTSAVQAQSLEEVIKDLKAKGNGSVSGFANVKRLAPYIDTVEKAQRALTLAEVYLNRAYARSLNYRFFDHLFGVYEANLNLLMSTYNSAKRIRARLPKESQAKLNERDAGAIALTLLLAMDNLKFTDKMVRESNNESSFYSDFLHELGQILKLIMDEVIKPAAKGVGDALMPLAIPILVGATAFMFIKSGMAKG